MGRPQEALSLGPTVRGRLHRGHATGHGSLPGEPSELLLLPRLLYWWVWARERGLLNHGDSGAVAQLGERLNGIQEVGGSTPLSSTPFFLTQN